MKRYFLSVTMLLALSACQGDEPQSTAPTASESVPAAMQSAPATAPSSPTESVSAQASAMPNEAAVQLAQTVDSAVAKARAEKMAEVAQAQHMASRQLASGLAAATAAAKAQQPALKMKAAALEKKAPAASQQIAVAAQEALPTVAKPSVPAVSPVAMVASGDAQKGKKLARKCAACHSFEAKKKVGPGLAGVFDREAGSVSGFKYGFTGFIQSGKAWHWDAAHLAAWLCDSKKAVKDFTGNAAAKTKMGAQRICDTAKQADIIAYLKTL